MKKNEIKIRKEVIREPLTSDIIFKAAGSCQNPWQAEMIMVKLKGA